MKPNENQPMPEDYLNQIAPKTSRKINLFNNKFILFGLAGAIILIIIFALIGSTSGGVKPGARLAARLAATSEITDSAALNIKSSKLRAINSNLKTFLTNTTRDIEAPLAKDKIDIKKIDKKILLAESNTAILATLEDARLNVVYDRTYTREMTYQLDTILVLIKQVSTKSKSTSFKAILDDAYKNLEIIQTQIIDYTEVFN